MQETKITKKRIQTHFTYSWWKYVLLAAVAIFGWNLIYTATAYRPPKDKRLDVTFATYMLPEETTSAVRDEILERYPSLEDSSVVSITYTTDDNYYGSMQLSTYMGAGEGDIYVLEKDRFIALAQSGAFLPLDDAIASGALDLKGIDVSAGVRMDENGVTAVYGIPAEALYGMIEGYGVLNTSLYYVVMAYTQNEEIAVDWIGWQIEKFLEPKPDWLQEYEDKNSAEGTEAISNIPSY